MKLITRLLMVAMLSIGIAWGLSHLPKMQTRMLGADQELAVFRELRPVELSYDNLVDYLSEWTLKLPLRQADWSYQILALDYELSGGVEPEDVYEQLIAIIRYGLAGTSNVERVQVRVFLPAGGAEQQRKLLLAVDAKRGQFHSREYEVWRLHRGNAEEWLSQRFQFTRTKRWDALIS